ncbi:AAA family ATPase [Tsukamurella tyrosinosolvens]|uniref:AAA family ATPase n=1 Tax=Tsukamurella tyrosinosolvens TaxID=57704 RepID=UPI0015F1390B|nr:AAA family ATPase [Tsukamurella tyrosinosolvens]
MANFMKLPIPGTPLILAIHGSPGTGKSFQLDKTLKDARIFYKTIDSTDLESDNANDPAKLVRRTYIDLADEVERKGYRAGALVINDIDAALGDWGDLVQTTVNRQLVIGELQHITDYPDRVDNRPNLRIPIIVTANDLTKLYGPLLRPGRTSSFHWHPTQEEIAQVLSPLLPHLTQNDVSQLVTLFDSCAIADYVDAIRLAADQKIDQVSLDFEDAIIAARLGRLEAYSNPTLAELTEARHFLNTERRLHDNYARST